MAPRSAVDVVALALEHTRHQVLPMRWGQWWRLAVLGLATGELSGGGGCRSVFNVPSGGEQGPFSVWPMDLSGLQVAALVGIFLVVASVIGLVLLYVNSVCRFVLIETVVLKRCDGIRAGWAKWRGPGRSYFRWQLAYQLALAVTLVLLIGIPCGIAFLAGWFTQPQEHLLPLILGGIALALGLLAVVVIAAVVYVLGKDFMAPIMALENLGFSQAWGRVLGMITAEKGSYAGYLGVKIALSFAVGLAMVVIVLALLIPLVLAAIGLAGLSGAGMAWSSATTGVLIVTGTFAILLLVSVIGLLSVPVTVFFPAYSLYFFASRYPPLDAWLRPAVDSSG